LQIFHYAASDIHYGLFFGNGWADSLFRDDLSRLYPDSLYFDDGFRKFSGPLDDQAARALFARQRCVYLIGSPVERFAPFGLSPSSLVPVARSLGGPAEAMAVYALRPGWQKVPRH
jgi:hypothetical protein